jgi:hypothetical protein
MKKEDLDRRCAEMKERMLAQKTARAMNEPFRPKRRRSSEENAGNRAETTSDSETAVLRERIARLEAENDVLRKRLAAISAQANIPARSTEDSVREQRHNFFKYSNVRRY